MLDSAGSVRASIVFELDGPSTTFWTMHLGVWMVELWLPLVMSQTGSTLSVAEVAYHETLVIQ